MQWEPIETAPTQEEFIHVVLVARDHNKRCAMPAIYDGRDWRALTIAGMMVFHDPTHWMPLPEPPESA
jgi:hypothetical protein